MKFQKICSAATLVCFCMMLLAQASHAVSPTVKIVVNPSKTTIYAGTEALVLTAQTSGEDLTYRWTLQGPGKLDNTNLPAVFYFVPETIDGESAQAVITVTVSDKSAQEVTESMTFQILTAKEKTPSLEEQPLENSSGMSSTTKIALGVGAAGVLGAGVALAVGGGSDDSDNNNPFTGTFRRDDAYSGLSWIIFLNLTQDGPAISGNLDMTRTDACCSVNVVSQITGQADGNSAVLSWPTDCASCTGTNGCSSTLCSGGGGTTTDQFTLSDDGKVLSNSGGSTHIRQ